MKGDYSEEEERTARRSTTFLHMVFPEVQNEEKTTFISCADIEAKMDELAQGVKDRVPGYRTTYARLFALNMLAWYIDGGQGPKVDVEWFGIVESWELFNKFAWGQIAWEKMYHHLGNKKLGTKMRNRQNGGHKNFSYDLNGFPWAFQTWLCEAIPEFGKLLGKRADEPTTPRISRWKWSKTKHLTDHVYSMVDSVTEVFPTLVPDSSEKATEYWQSYLRYEADRQRKPDTEIDAIAKAVQGFVVLCRGEPEAEEADVAGRRRRRVALDMDEVDQPPRRRQRVAPLTPQRPQPGPSSPQQVPSSPPGPSSQQHGPSSQQPASDEILQLLRQMNEQMKIMKSEIDGLAETVKAQEDFQSQMMEDQKLMMEKQKDIDFRLAELMAAQKYDHEARVNMKDI